MTGRMLLALFVGAGICVAGPTTARAEPGDPGESRLVKRFNEAIADAAVYRHRNLRRLRPLVFDPATGRASVTTLTSDRYRLGTTTLPEDVWVTGDGEVRRRCRCRRRPGMFLRQLLGLHPNSPIWHFVTLSVSRADVFRPAVDPDTTTRWPCRNPRAASCGQIFPTSTPVSHLIWMANQMAAAWEIATPLARDGYPWTRLGYTYNWRPGADRYGASEYVLREGATVTVTAVTPYRRYCRASGHRARAG
jgi:hypothetical protein